MTSTPMTKVASIDAVRNGPIGAFFFESAKDGDAVFRRLWVKLSEGFSGGFNLSPAPQTVPFIHQWNGDEESPTIHRDIHVRGRWRGEVRDGRVYCGELGASTQVQPPSMNAPRAKLPPPLEPAIKKNTTQRRTIPSARRTGPA